MLNNKDLCAVFFPRDVLDEILNLIELVSEGFFYLHVLLRKKSSAKYLSYGGRDDISFGTLLEYSRIFFLSSEID